MYDFIEWLDERANPSFSFEGISIAIKLQPVSVDHGPEPTIVQFKAACAMPHSTDGLLIYTVNRLSFMPPVFAGFARDLGLCLDGHLDQATLAPVGRDFVVDVARADKGLSMKVSVTEWLGPLVPEMTACSYCRIGNTDVIYGWVRDLNAYAAKLDEWVLLNRPEY